LTICPQVDMLTLGLQCTAFVLRLVVLLSFVEADRERYLRLQFDFQLWGLLAFLFRCLELLNFHPELGEVFLIVKEMIKETVPVLCYMLVVAIWAGIALAIGRSGLDGQEVGTRPQFDMRHWSLAGVWAILG
jgi:hypothetical protein